MLSLGIGLIDYRDMEGDRETLKLAESKFEVGITRVMFIIAALSLQSTPKLMCMTALYCGGNMVL